MRLAFVNVKGANDSPLFKAPDNKRWMLGLNNRVYGPYDTKDEAVRALQTELLIMQGVR